MLIMLQKYNWVKYGWRLVVIPNYYPIVIEVSRGDSFFK